MSGSMSYNQSKAGRSDSLQYREKSRPGSTGKGGGPSSQAAHVEPDPVIQETPTKAPGDASESFPIQLWTVGRYTLNEMQGMMHQGQGLNLMTNFGPQMPPQLGNMGAGAESADNNLKTKSKSASSTRPEDSFDSFRKDNNLVSTASIVPDAYESALTVETLARKRSVKSFHRSLILSPTTPAPVMHKAEKKYRVGKISDGEEAKRRQLKAILNKLMPQNFKKLVEQIIAVNIDSVGTLVHFVSQIYDKALIEPIYANLCFHIAGELPDFIDYNEKITFKRLLLNKCQEEFERGRREQEESAIVDVEGEFEQSPEEREEKRVQTRRRFLGNTRLLGELYKKRMLTERIMHECIKKLLHQYENPIEEDIEALCILMSIIGEMIDHPKSKEHMDTYFDMMSRLSNNMKLSSRVRFMLKDANDLRKNKWQQRNILSGPMQLMGSQGGMQRINSNVDRWRRATSSQNGLIPSPTTPAPVMHKAEKKYRVGKISDGEEAKRRQLKAILNKLMPQNFKKLVEQIIAVNIDSVGTLVHFVSQIYDKALIEPIFCEMHANLCFHIAGELPDFIDYNEKITFKRLLLNKCQEEFERGRREQEESAIVDVEGEFEQSPEEREEKRVQTRRRFLGNTRLLGELYKKRMLTERIMHECIKKLLHQYENPIEEDIEALCILMSIIGEMIDHPKSKKHMDTYFDVMSRLSNNMKLSSRVRFMLKDANDLRKNKWQQRNILSGPMQLMGSQGGMQRIKSNVDRWLRATSSQNGLIPSPSTPPSVMHKAEKKYQVGKLKASLHKLMQQNFEKLLERVKVVNIDNAGTLSSVVSQIFEKALMEPTFCEIYADLCYHLAGELPDFTEDNERITFKRLLVNNCQEEFERAEKEQEEAGGADVEGEVEQSPEEREEKRNKMQRRFFGNIRFIGELYKKRMLTEKVMHKCIQKLLGQYKNPVEEDIEAVCILMSIIGEMIDHPKSKEHMDAYFDMMSRLSNNMKLSSRVRLVLKDAIDLRENKWAAKDES